MSERYPRLRVSVLIEDRLTQRAVVRSVSVTPQQLDAYKGNVFIAAARTLTASLITQQEFLDFLEKADPLWKNILLEIPVGKRGVSMADDMLAHRYCDKEVGMFNEAFHRQCLSKFGGDPENHLRSPYFLVEITVNHYQKNQGEILVVATGDPEDIDKLKIHQTVSVVVQHDVMMELTEALLLGKLALPSEGQVYGKFTLEWLKSQGWVSSKDRALTLREKARADAAMLVEEERKRVEALKPKVPDNVAPTAAGAR